MDIQRWSDGWRDGRMSKDGGLDGYPKMEGWMDGWTGYPKMEGWVRHGQMGGWMDERNERKIDGLINERQSSRRVYGWMEECSDG